MIENFFYSYRYLILASDLTLLLGIVTVAHYRNSSNGIFTDKIAGYHGIGYIV